MKAGIKEYLGCFDINLEAESMEEAAAITRFGMNHIRDIRHIGTTVSEGGKFYFNITVGKHYRACSSVPKRK